MLKIDFHIHTSDDPVDSIDHSTYGLIDRAASLAFDAVAVTLHDHQLDDECLRSYARERGVLLLPGVERTICGRHVLLIDFPEEAARIRTFDDLRRVKRRSNGLVIAPHPFFPGGTSLGSLMDTHADLVDAVEWSYFWTHGANFNAAAKRWADRHGKPLVGNSDLHDLRQLGRTYSFVEAERDVAAICEAVRRGRAHVQTEAVPVLELAQVFGGMMWRGRRRPAQLQGSPDAALSRLARPAPGVAD